MSSTVRAVEIPLSMSISQAGPAVYRREDYVGAFRHLVILAVDFLVILFFVFPLSLLPAVFLHSLSAEFATYYVIVPLVLAWLYLAVLKPSRIRSPGYWVTGARIVTINGGRPSPFCMTLRLASALLWLFAAPIGFFFIDILWTTAYFSSRQTSNRKAGDRFVVPASSSRPRNRCGRLSNSIAIGIDPVNLPPSS